VELGIRRKKVRTVLIFVRLLIPTQGLSWQPVGLGVEGRGREYPAGTQYSFSSIHRRRRGKLDVYSGGGLR